MRGMRWLIVAALSWPLAQAARAQGAGAPDGIEAASAWAKARIAAGHPADFDLVCPKGAKPAASDPCRTIRASLLEELIRDTPKDAQRRTDIAGAVIEGDLDLTDTAFEHEAAVTNSLIRGAVDLSRARFASRLSFEGSTLEQKLDGSGLLVGDDLRLNDASFKAGLVLNEAQIKGPLSLVGVAIEKNSPTDDYALNMANASVGIDLNLSNAAVNGINANAIQVGGRIYADHLTSAADLFFGDAWTREDTWFKGGRFGNLILDSIHVGSTLHFEGGVRVDGLVTLDGAQIDHFLAVDGACFAAGLSAKAIHVGQQVRFADSQVAGDLDLSGTRLEGGLETRDVTFYGPTRMRLIHVGQDLDVSGAHLSDLDLSGAVVEGVLHLSRAEAGTRPTHATWLADSAGTANASCRPQPSSRPPGKGSIRLVNAKVGSLEGSLNAWPAAIAFSGFSYQHIDVVRSNLLPDDQAAAWRGWLERDRFSPQHYQQLSNVLASDGDRDGASAILYASRDRERVIACRAHRWATCVPLTLLAWTAGYGIGEYTWIAAVWIGLLILVGAVLVWIARRHESRNVFWPVGAAIEKILPYVQLDRSFTEFFEQQREFRTWQKIAFAALGLLGSALGLVLAAAASGLIQRG